VSMNFFQQYLLYANTIEGGGGRGEDFTRVLLARTLHCLHTRKDERVLYRTQDAILYRATPPPVVSPWHSSGIKCAMIWPENIKCLIEG
jgi:hypothetical protein